MRHPLADKSLTTPRSDLSIRNYIDVVCDRNREQRFLFPKMHTFIKTEGWKKNSGQLYR